VESDREIGWAENLTASLQDRLPDLQAAIHAGVSAVSTSLVHIPKPSGWKIDTVETRFGISLTAEGGAIIAKAGLGTTLDVNVKLTRSEDA
jgi:hypothetical protein